MYFSETEMIVYHQYYRIFMTWDDKSNMHK